MKTTTRETSIEAYYKVKETGLLSTLRLEVFKILCEHGAMTAGEMRDYCGDKVINSGVYATRLSELLRMGVIKEVGKRPCNKTGFTAIVWDITGDMPKALPKKLTRKEKKEAVLNKIATHGNRELPTSSEEINLYKNELREIYRDIQKL